MKAELAKCRAKGRPAPQWSYETAESVTTTIRNYLGPAIIGLPIMDRHGLHQRMVKTIGRGPETHWASRLPKPPLIWQCMILPRVPPA